MRVPTHAIAEAEKLAKVAQGASKISQVTNHLRKMEVTLNHNLLQFFHLAPDDIRNRLFTEMFGKPCISHFELHGRSFNELFNIDSVQPDLLFTSKSEVVCIEMKIGAKCSVDQILKYAMIGLAVEMRHDNQPMRHNLMLLGAGTVAAQFKEKFASVNELKETLVGCDVDRFLANKPERFRECKERFTQVLHNLNLRFWNYGELSAFLQQTISGETGPSPSETVYEKLVDGLVKEFKLRNLV